MMTVYIKTNNGSIEDVSPTEKSGYVPMECSDDDFFQIWPFYKIENDHVVFDAETYFKPSETDMMVSKKEDGTYIAYKSKAERRGTIPFPAEDLDHDDVMLHINDYYDVDEGSRTISVNQEKKDVYGIYREYRGLVRYLQDTDGVDAKREELGEEAYSDIVRKREEATLRINEIQEEIDINLFL
jgi:hypothetical protein